MSQFTWPDLITALLGSMARHLQCVLMLTTDWLCAQRIQSWHFWVSVFHVPGGWSAIDSACGQRARRRHLLSTSRYLHWKHLSSNGGGAPLHRLRETLVDQWRETMCASAPFTHWQSQSHWQSPRSDSGNRSNDCYRCAVMTSALLYLTRSIFFCVECRRC